MKKIIVIILIHICTINLKAQSKVRFPVWTFHDDSTTVNGLSVGLNVGLNRINKYLIV